MLVNMRVVGGPFDGEWRVVSTEDRHVWLSPVEGVSPLDTLAMRAINEIKESVRLVEYRRHEIWHSHRTVHYFLAPVDWDDGRALMHLFGHEEFRR